tara:strand:- start:3190 stop:3795 length:606 start_codon:yes stop_codon:yes gene_type:complete
MATVASGQIDMNAVHAELGGSSGSQIGFGDLDLNTMCNKSSGSQFSMSEMYSRAVDFGTSGTVGAKAQTFSPTYVSFTDYYRGYASDLSMGTMAGTSDPDYMGGGTISRINAEASNVVTAFKTFRISSNASNISNDDNSVFNSVVINTTTFDRGDFTFNTTTGATALTIQSQTGGFQDTTSTISPFPSVGTSYAISFRRRI